MTSLSPKGSQRLAKYEAVIDAHQAGFVKVANALTSIRDEKLYREFGTFEDYCRVRWGFSATRGRQLMAAAEIATDVAVSNEAQARELVSAPPEERAAIVEEAKAENDGKLTAPAIRKARQKRKDTNKGGTDDDGSVSGGDAAPSSDGADSHDAGRSESESVPPPPPVIDTTSREVHVHRCECGATWHDADLSVSA